MLLCLKNVESYDAIGRGSALPLTVLAGLGAAVLIYFLILLVRNEAVFIPLPQDAIDSMLKMADLRPDDVLFDLGSGDGRIVICDGQEIWNKGGRSRILTWLTMRAIRKNKLEDKIRILNANLFEQDLTEATVVTVYLSQKTNDRLEPKLRKELKEGTRILSADHTFHFPEKTKLETGHFWTRLYIR